MDRTVLLVSVSYSFHLIATVVWLGWSVMLVIAHRPKNQFDGGVQNDPYRFVRRTMPIALLAFTALVVTGLYQMVTDSHYEDMFVFDNTWSRLLLFKHVAFAAEAVVLLAIRFVLEPDLDYYRRAEHAGMVSHVRHRYRLAAWLNLALGGLILVLTGMLTALP